MSPHPRLYHWEPNLYFLKPLIALHEKEVGFDSCWFDPTTLEQFAPQFPANTESALQLEREGPLLMHGDAIISSSYFMLEYIAAAFAGIDLNPGDAWQHYRARACAQFLNGLGADVSLLGCARYLAPVLQKHDQQDLRTKLQTVEPQERRDAWLAVIDGTYDETAKQQVADRLQFPLGRIERTLAASEWVAGDAYSIADIDAFAVLRPLLTLAPERLNAQATPNTIDFLMRVEARPAVRRALAMSRSGRPQECFVPGAEASRWG
jgi:glutathione S-transferase